MNESAEVPIEAPPQRPTSDGTSGSPPAKRRIWVWIVVFALLAVVPLGVMSGIRRGKADQAAQVEPAEIPTIKTATACVGQIGFYVEALGTVTPVATVNLYSQVNGRVIAVHYLEGQMVHRGDLLIDLDPRPYEAQLKEAQGTLQHDRAVLAQAEMDLQRYKEASDLQAIAKQTYEDQRQAVDQDKGTVQNDIGQVEYAQIQLSYCRLTSPMDGRVGLRLIDPGNTVFSGASNPLVVITQLRPVTVVFNVAEDDLRQVQGAILHRTPLQVDAFDRSQQVRLATGKLLTLDNQIDTSTGTVRFRSQFDNADLKLYPNQFVNARLLVKTLKNSVLVPTAAIQRNGTQAFVYVVTGNAVALRKVDELTTENDFAAVTGLLPREVVSVSGFDKLQDGAKVKVLGPSNAVFRAPSKDADAGSAL